MNTMARLTVDMHLHSNLSDGMLSPAELVDRCRRFAVNYIALTDHDTAAGWDKARAACSESGIRFMPGMELTVYVGAVEIHLLAYGLERYSGSRLEYYLNSDARVARTQRFWKMVEKLEETGLAIDRKVLIKYLTVNGVEGRLHLARALVEMGHVKNVSQAFHDYLIEGRPGYVEKYNLQPETAIEWVHDAGGAAIMAHPGVTGHEELIADMFRYGLDGLEAYHCAQSSRQTEWLATLSTKYGGIVTGGSDFHTPDGRCEPGFPAVPESCWEDTLARIQQYC